MPTTTEILALLEKTSNELLLVAIGFHVLILAAIIALIRDWRPTHRSAGILLILPLLMVSVIAWAYGNPFTGIIFLIFFFLLLIISLKLSQERVQLSKGIWLFIAILLIDFGWFYPHFLDDRSWMYVFAAPTGLIPCPTLSLVIGFTLLFQHFHSRSYALALVAIGLFYGLFGVLKLGVIIDAVLIFGTIALTFSVFYDKQFAEHNASATRNDRE
jgi:hypothetical protein